jgi:hypothetical protein
MNKNNNEHSMKKLIFFLILSFSANAEPIYCPEQINCRSGNCDFEDPSKNLWQKISGYQGGEGRYFNTYVSAPFYSTDQGYALCMYTHESSKKTLTLHAKPESHLEMLIQDHEPWRAEETWWECKPKYSTTACPMQQQIAITIKNKTHQTLFLSDNLIIKPGQFKRLYQGDLPYYFIDIYTDTNFIGRVNIDYQNDLHIRDIIEGDSQFLEIHQVLGFNAVEVSD